MADSPSCPRCGAETRAGDEVCRRCGTDLPKPEKSSAFDVTGGVVKALAGAGVKEPFSLPWLLIGVVGYTALLFLGFQLFAGTFMELVPVFAKIRTEADARAHADVLTDLALKVLVLVAAAYAIGGIVLGRVARGRAVLQAVLAALFSWLFVSLRATVLPAAGAQPILLPLFIGGAVVTVTAALGAWFGYWLRPKR